MLYYRSYLVQEYTHILWVSEVRLCHYLNKWYAGSVVIDQDINASIHTTARIDKSARIFFQLHTSYSCVLAIIIPELAIYPNARYTVRIRSEERRVGKECRSRWS